LTAVAIVLVGVSLLLAAWSYLAYPALLSRLAGRAPERGKAAGPATQSVEVLVAAANEEAVIGERVRNLLAQAPEHSGSLRIAIGCDGSTDGTAQAARAAGGDRVSVAEFPVRRGKASVLNDLVAASPAHVLVFTDANTTFEPGAVAALCRALEPERVGAACGTLVLRAMDAGGLPEEEFWDRETRLKKLEGALGLCLGANGAIYAAKRAAVAPLPPDTTSMDDFLIPLGILRRGGEVVFARDAVAFEPAGRTVRAEASRRFRIGVGAGQVLRRERWLWNVPRHPTLSLIFFSRKVCRWLAPVIFLAGIAFALASPDLRLAAGLGIAAAATVSSLARRPYYFGVINLSLAAGVVAGFFGYSRPAWKSHR
jgi:cellulose synthase/poly-beta-1,6-N-acetylglucosamine synthase-like glycosyltransferase